MTCYMLKMNKGGKLYEGYNEGVDWVLPHFQAIKVTSDDFTRDLRKLHSANPQVMQPQSADEAGARGHSAALQAHLDNLMVRDLHGATSQNRPRAS